MIERAVILNFQSHKKTVLEFHEGVNVIVGNSDCGKSAIIKALNWNINNKPNGTSYRSHWGGDTEVILQLSHDKGLPIQVHRLRKGETGNLYKLNMNDGSKIMEFKSFGKSGVPIEIEEVFNMSEINFQFQIDKPFLLSESSGEVARYFNKVASLDEIDSSMSNANKYVNRVEKKLVELEGGEEHYKEEIEKYNKLKDHKQELKKLLSAEKDIEQAEFEIVLLEGIIKQIKEYENDLKEYDTLSDIDQELKKLNKLLEDTEETDSDIEELEQMVDKITRYETKRKVSDSILQNEKRIQEVDVEIKELEELSGQIKSLSNLISQIEVLEQEYEASKDRLMSAEEALDELIREGTICPVCHQEIKKVS